MITKLRKGTVSFVVYIHPHVPEQIPLADFREILYLLFTKICRHISILAKPNKTTGILHKGVHAFTGMISRPY
jgi:hypothetical protein